MICDKCGKSNISDLLKCSYCGAEMPKTTNYSGFADILNFEASGTGSPVIQKEPIRKEDTKLKGINALDVQKLLKNTDDIMKSTQKNLLFSFITIALSLLILISSLIIGITTISTVKGYKKESEVYTQPDTIPEETEEKTEDDKITNPSSPLTDVEGNIINQ